MDPTNIDNYQPLFEYAVASDQGFVLIQQLLLLYQTCVLLYFSDFGFEEREMAAGIFESSN